MDNFEKMIHEMFDDIWDCEIDHPLFQDTVGDLMREVIEAHKIKQYQNGTGERRMTELKPCPFCGKKARLQRIGDSYYVTCDGSYCKIKPTTWAYSVKEKAIEEWNRRAKDD